MASIRKSRGQPRHFTEAQNAALHKALGELREKRGLSPNSRLLAELLGIGQQAAGRLAKDSNAGFSSATAQHLVSALGYASPETFFRARGISIADESKPEARSA